MLTDFLVTNREAIIARAKAWVVSRASPSPTDVELTNGIPLFLDQLGIALVRARASETVDHSQIHEGARRHGNDLFRVGLTVGQVVHDYGDVCQAVTQLAVEQGAPISAEEFRTLNLCLDDAIAGAVTEYARQTEETIEAQGTERLGLLAHEMRNLLNTATLAFESIKSGRVASGGSTAQVLGRSLMGLRDLIDRSLADVRLDAGISHLELLPVAELLEEIDIGASVQAEAREIHFVTTAVDRNVAVEGDRQILVAAVSNLLHNTFKFTPLRGHVSLTTRVSGDRMLFEIEDECGGLPPGKSEELFRPFEQRSQDRRGAGLGLSICMKAAKANHGSVRVRDLPGKGCVFTLDLPKRMVLDREA